jgi:hypothetical protein
LSEEAKKSAIDAINIESGQGRLRITGNTTADGRAEIEISYVEKINIQLGRVPGLYDALEEQ